MRLSDLLRTAPPVSRRRRRVKRADGPTTIVPVEDAPPVSAAPEPTGSGEASLSPFDLRLDAARERLRRAIPPVDDEI